MATLPDDVKYTQRYNDLKRKVKEIELDNDKLHLKVLKTKKNIQRLHLERAILYERLSAIPPPPQPSSPPPPPPPPRHSHSRQYPPPTSPKSSAPNITFPSDQYQPTTHRLPSIPPPPPSNEDYRSPPSSSRHPPSSRSPYPSHSHERERERDRDLGGPGLPPIRTHPHPHPYSHMDSSPVPHHPRSPSPLPLPLPLPLPPPPPSHHHSTHPSNGYNQYPTDDRNWERESERDREFSYRDRHRVQQHNGYSLPPQPYSRTYDPPPPPPRYDHRYHSHPQSPPIEYDSRSHHSHSRRSSASYPRDYPPPPPPPPPHHPPPGPYEYSHHTIPSDSARRPEEYEQEYDDHRQAQQPSRAKEREREPPVSVPRVREGEPME